MGDLKSQKDAVYEYMKNNKTGITSNDAIYKFGATRLSAIIHTLRHRDGYRIDTVMETGKTRFGNTTKYARYILKEDK